MPQYLARDSAPRANGDAVTAVPGPCGRHSHPADRAGLALRVPPLRFGSSLGLTVSSGRPVAVPMTEDDR